jgi:hypothetical protein
LKKRLKFLRDAVRDAIHESSPEIKISRWEPGHVHVGQPLDSPISTPRNKSDKKPRRRSSLSPKSNDRKGIEEEDEEKIDVSEAKETNTNIIRVHRSDTSEIRMKYASQEDHDLHAYRVAHDHLLIKAANRLRHRRFSHRIMRKGPSSLSISYHDVRPHHELDGFVHVEEHDAFPDYVSDASEQQVPSDLDEDEEVMEGEDYMVKLDAGVSRTELLEEVAKRRRNSVRRRGSGDSDLINDGLHKIEKSRRFSAPGSFGGVLGSLDDAQDLSSFESAESDSFLRSPRGSKKDSVKKTLSNDGDSWRKRSLRNSSKKTEEGGVFSIELSKVKKKKKDDGDSDDKMM